MLRLRNLSSTLSRSALTRSMATQATLVYPIARRSDTIEQFKSKLNGTVSVRDPYDYLHDPENPETIDFVKSQATLTSNYLKGNPDAAKFKA